MTFHIVFDDTKCQGYANCLIEAPDVWDFDEDENKAVLRVPEPEETVRARVEASVRCCPAQAISLGGGTA